MKAPFRVSIWRLLSLGLAIGLFATSCGPPPPSAVDLLGGRPDGERYRLEERFRGLERLGFGGDPEEAPWKTVGLEVQTRQDGSWTVQSSALDPHLWREVELEAAGIAAIRLVVHRAFVAELGPAPPEPEADGPPFWQLFWAGDEGAFSEAAQIAALHPLRAGETQTFVFPVALSPSWSGHIAKLRLDPPRTVAQGWDLVSLETLAVEMPAPISSAEVTPEAEVRLLELPTGRGGIDRRSGWALAPGESAVRELVVPPDARLRFSYGLDEPEDIGGWRRASVRLRASVVPTAKAAGSTLEAAPFRQMEIVLPPSSGGEWVDTHLDLDTLAGQRVRVRFEVDTDDLAARSYAAVLVAGPEVSSRLTRRDRPNVVLISIDTLRSDRLSLFGYRRVTSPRLDAWARESAVAFPQVVVSSPWTLPSHVSLLSGLDALHHGINHRESALSESLPYLPTELRRAGYRTLALTGGAYLTPTFGFSHGFDRFRWWSEGDSPAEELRTHVDIATRWLEELRDRPFFLFLHTYEVHAPFFAREPHLSAFAPSTVPPGVEQAFFTPLPWIEEDGFLLRHEARVRVGEEERALAGSPADRNALSALYDSGVAETDAQLGRFFDRLRELDLWENTVVIVTSDHGESLGEGGRLAHGNLSDENLLVPLLIAYPRRFEGGRIETAQLRSVDVVPTVLHLAGIDPLAGIDGESFVPILEGEAPAPRPAWAYSGGTNRGLALRLTDGTTALANDAPWPGLCDNESIELRGAAASPAADELDPAWAAYRKELRGHRARHTHGLVLQARNEGSDSLELRLEGFIVSCVGGQAIGWRVSRSVLGRRGGTSGVDCRERRRASSQLAATLGGGSSVVPAGRRSRVGMVAGATRGSDRWRTAGPRRTERQLETVGSERYGPSDRGPRLVGAPAGFRGSGRVWPDRRRDSSSARGPRLRPLSL